MENPIEPSADKTEKDSPPGSSSENQEEEKTKDSPSKSSNFLSPVKKAVFVVKSKFSRKNYSPNSQLKDGKKIFNSLPRLKQLKYLPRFLTPKEQSVIKILIGVIFLNIIFWGTQFYLTHQETVPTSGAVYTEAMVGSPQSINPIIGVTSDVDKDLAMMIYSGLLKYNKDHKLIPDVASNYTISEDEKTYTFYLKQNVSWHDEEPLTADDIIFTIKTIQNPAYKSPLFVSFKSVGIEKLDNYTVKFTLAESFAPFLSILTIGILPKHLWETIPPEQFSLAAYNTKPIGSGPYRFKSLSKNKLGKIKTYTLEVNKQYYERPPFIKNITFKFYLNISEAQEALLNQQVDGINYLPKELKARIETEPRINFYSLLLPQYTAIFFNQNNNQFLKNKKVRQALASSINKEKILNDALNQEGKIIHGPILPGSIGYNPDIRKYEFDLEKARGLIAQAGFVAITDTEYQELITKKQSVKDSLEKNLETATSAPAVEVTASQKTYFQKGDNILEITLTTADQPELQKASELIQKFWQQLGIKTSLNIVPNAEIKSIIQNRAYDAFLYGIITGFDPDPYPFWHSSQNQAPGLNLAIFSNKDVDHVLEDARKTTDEKVRQDKYVHFQNILIEELPAIFLYSPTYTYALNSKVKGFDITRITQPADRFANIEEWYIKTKKVIKW